VNDRVYVAALISPRSLIHGKIKALGMARVTLTQAGASIEDWLPPPPEA
jgi:hypothetical protein